ncbi:MAG: pectinesterase family protein, partial [Candidatus Bathyarchaeia archaeon]
MRRKAYAILKIMLIIALFIVRVDFRMHADATPKIWTVAKDGSGDFRTIQEAILNDGVSTGDMILVRKGTYAENIVINKSISLIGESPDETIIN